MSALFLTEAEVTQVLDMPTALAAVASAHEALARGEAADFPRQRVRGGAVVQHLLQGGLFDRQVIGFKTYTSNRDGAHFWLHLFDAAGGLPLAVIEADALGMHRTGAAGAVAASRLAREDAREAVMFGAGWQARGQLLALAQVRPIERFTVFARDQERLRRFCAEMSQASGRQVLPGEDAQASLARADVVITVTSSPKPLFDGAWLVPGTHITAAGSNSLIRRELDETAVQRCTRVVVDSRATALREAGDLLPALEKGRLRESALIELGEILIGARSGRASAEEITLFESQGMAIQDLALGLEVLERARKAGLGTVLPY
ncbi:ornithine cyclodeaminase family protein [Niveibacterium sp. SC-1]|uniref:ornithine cyclodeaminase family protein n=1 Tax=Niveibacterium sp. SC-1 TaxID=3135646 RepID=UPI0031202EA5